MTKRIPQKLDQFGFREGSIRSQAAALYINGATSHEVTIKLGAPQLNVLAVLEGKGFTIKKKRIRVGGKGRPQFIYSITMGNENEN